MLSKQLTVRHVLIPSNETKSLLPPVGKKGVRLSSAHFVSSAEALNKIRRKWSKFHGTRDRFAVYEYLESIFEFVMDQQRKGRSKKLLAKLSQQNGAASKNIFAAAIKYSAMEDPLDPRTQSKWSRALRYAAENKRAGESLRSFMLRHGGINNCAAHACL